jgi:hypothetical protein
MKYNIENIHPKIFGRIHRIEPVHDTCPKCGIERVANIPSAVSGWVGFRSTEHECGPTFILRIWVPTNPKKRKSLESIYKGLIGND